MRIAIDATPLTVESGGITRYTAELASALAAEFPEDEYWLVSDQEWKDGPAAQNLHRGGRPGSWVARRWWLAGLPLELARRHVDVFHGTDFAVPYLPLRPSVLTLHDLSPWAEGQRRTGAAERVRRRTPYLLRRATMIITPTEAIRREAARYFELPLARMAAVPLAAGWQFRPCPEAETAAALARLGITIPYLLCIGTKERRKNLPRLIETWREVRKRQPQLGLVLAGRACAEESQVLNLSTEPGLSILGFLPDQDIATLMSGAALFVYPSLYEGFGLPVLEAMQTGTPVVISRDAALLEVAGDAAAAVDAESSAAMARAIVELMENPARRLELRERGLRRAAQFSWRQTAATTREIYVEALRRF
ncbi:MAG: glycosyltransferase family 4 protein [Acidobacteria bacterium]|nr:glycosyltransferase family 4 protein [Acidobacteriota bacterium]